MTINRLFLLVFATFVAGAGCATRALTVETTPYFTKLAAPDAIATNYRGESCATYLFGIVPLGGDASAATATERALYAAGNDEIGLLTVDERTTFFLLATEVCTIATVKAIANHRGVSAVLPSESRATDAAPPRPRANLTPSRPVEDDEGTYLIAGDIGRMQAAETALERWVGQRVVVSRTDGEADVEGTLRSVSDDQLAVRTRGVTHTRVPLAVINAVRLVE